MLFSKIVIEKTLSFSSDWGECRHEERPVLLFFDQASFLHHGPWVQAHFPTKKNVFVLREKSRKEARRLETLLLKQGWGKETLFVAIGGGGCCDVVAFLASIYRRGVPLWLIPTTLLAMVDAAIGGKTGLDTPWGKNSLGTFYFPEKVLLDPRFLTTLSPEARLHGLAEVLKIALVSDKALWDILKPPLPSDLLPWIMRAIEAKMRVVTQDPLETSGHRSILNFGHTLGHAIELASDPPWPHGLAVALGSLAEAFFSFQKEFLSKDSWEEIAEKYQAFGYSFPPLPSMEKIRALLQYDKKNRKGKVRAILLKEIGAPIHAEGTEVDDPEELSIALLHLQERGTLNRIRARSPS